MTVGVYALEKILYRGEASSVNCPTQDGEITILDHHRPLISLLKNGVIKILDKSGETKYISVASGFLEVQPQGRVKILLSGSGDYGTSSRI
ncbi:MAG TPA: F0F1 ATP synthase subunit epsilon [Candidatus Tyrphobacter sp.]|nr:F0F1 ATP synthase subunit epsilon [Candidatus Tyrphobacter sp.]